MEPLTLAAAAVALLAPYLGKVGENAADATTGGVARLYRAIKEKFRDDDYVLRGAEERPGSSARLRALEGAVAEAVESDPEFAAEVASLVREGQSISDAGAVAGRDVRMLGTYVAGRDMNF